MNKSIKMIITVVGVAILGYGIFMLVEPESVVSIGSLDIVETQDNNNAHITIALGVVLLFIGLLGSKK